MNRHIQGILVCFVSILFGWIIGIAAAPVAVYKEPVDANIRQIIPERIMDGDSFVATVIWGKLGQQEIRTTHTKIRLKGVYCFEMDDKTDDGKKVAVMERDKLNEYLMADSAQPIYAKFYARQTHDRYEAIIYTKERNVNEAMKLFPQGGN